MFFTLSKLLDVAVDPWWLIFMPLAVGLWLSRGARKRLGAGLVMTALVLMVVLALPAVSNRLWTSLEGAAPSTFQPDVTYDAVVLLGGAVSPAGSLRDEPAWNDNVERLLTVRELMVTGRAKLAIVSGGELGGNLKTEAEYLQEELFRLGVERERVVVEAGANNTRENATLSKALLERLGAHRVLLVTSAFHMPRAQGCFRAAGVEADVLPVDFRLRNLGGDSHLVPRAEYLSQSARALREWLGRAVYALLGYTQ